MTANEQQYKTDVVLSSIILDAVDELKSAMAKHVPMNSAHEAYSVILEEVDEFWLEVKKRREQRSPERMKEELTQIAAMAMRAIHDLNL